MLSELLPYSKYRIGPELPEIPPDEWCDFRLEYEQGKTLKQIASDYHCDPRTVRKSLLLNQGSNDIGKQNCSKKITAFVPRINDLYQKYTGINDSENRFRIQITKKSYPVIICLPKKHISKSTEFAGSTN